MVWVAIGAEPRVEIRLGCAATPVAGHVVDLQAESFGHLSPHQREVAGLENQHAVAGRQRVHQRGFGGAGAGRRKHDHRAAGLEHHAKPFEDIGGQLRELGTAVIDDRLIHRAQDAIGNVGGAGDLKEVSTGVQHGTGEFTARTNHRQTDERLVSRSLIGHQLPPSGPNARTLGPSGILQDAQLRAERR